MINLFEEVNLEKIIKTGRSGGTEWVFFWLGLANFMCKWKQTMSLCTTKAIISHGQACRDFELGQRNTHVSSLVYSICFLEEFQEFCYCLKKTKNLFPTTHKKIPWKQIPQLYLQKKSMLLIQYNLVSFGISSDLYLRAVFKISDTLMHLSFQLHTQTPILSLIQVMTTRGCYHLNCIFYGNYRSKTASLITY